MKLIIEDDEGRKTVIPLVRDEISIGRQEGNTIRLTERNVSRRHARLFKQSGQVFIEDLGSSYGIRVNGDRIDTKVPIFDGDRIQIGDYGLAVEGAPRPADKEPTRVTRAPLEEAQLVDEEVTPVGSPLDAGKVIPPERMPHFMGLTGSVWGLELPLSRTIMSFGRAQDANDLVIDHPSVSRTHGRLKFEGNTWRIYDLGSSQGLKVNGRSVNASVIQPGDTVDIGQTQFRFCAPGDDFQPPKTGFVSAAGETQIVAMKRPKTALYVAVISVLVLAAAAVVAWKMLGSAKSASPTQGDNACQKAEAAINAHQWSDAVAAITTVKQSGQACSFATDTSLRSAKLNLDAKTLLDQSESLAARGSFRQAIQALTRISSESLYADAARAKVSELKLAAGKQLSMDVQTGIDRGNLESAESALNDLQTIDPDAPALPFLRKQLSEKKAEKPREEKLAKEEKTVEARPSPKPETVAAATPTPKEEKKAPEPTASSAERDQVAQTAFLEGTKLLSQGDMKAGIERLQFVIAQKPRAELIALAHKNIGVAYAKAHQTDEAIPHLKIYLKLRPDAPDREKIEQLVQTIETKQ